MYTADTTRLNNPQSIHTRELCAINTPKSTMTFGIVIVQAPLLPNGTVKGRGVSGSTYLSRRYAQNSSKSVRLQNTHKLFSIQFTSACTYLLKNVSRTTNASKEKLISTAVVIVWKRIAATGVPYRVHSSRRIDGSIL